MKRQRVDRWRKRKRDERTWGRGRWGGRKEVKKGRKANETFTQQVINTKKIIFGRKW